MKKLRFVSIFFIFVLLLAACGTGNDNNANGNSKDSNGEKVYKVGIDTHIRRLNLKRETNIKELTLI